MVLGPDEAPEGMNAEPATLTSPYAGGKLSEAKESAELGVLLGWTQGFTTPSAQKGGKVPKAGALGFYSLASTAVVSKDAAAAKTDYDDITPPTREQKGYKLEQLDVELGDQARRSSWREKSNFGGTVPFMRISWLRGNARFALGGYGVKPADIDKDALLALAQQLDKEATPGAKPALELPEPLGGGAPVVEDSFDDPKSGFKAEQFTNAATEYDDGKWLMRVDDGGYIAPFAGKSALRLTDLRVQFDGAVTSKKGNFGAICRHGPKDQYYVAAADTDGAVTLGHVTGGKNTRYVALAEVSDVKVSKKPRVFALHCVGEELVRLQVHLDGELVAEAFDLEASIKSGAPGLYVETNEAPVTAEFDNFTVFTP